MGFDVSSDAVKLARKRLRHPTKTESDVLKRGRKAYANADTELLEHLGGLAMVPVQRNKGIDAVLQQQFLGRPITVRVQRANESLEEAAAALHRASRSKHARRMLLVATKVWDPSIPLPDDMYVISSARAQVDSVLESP